MRRLVVLGLAMAAAGCQSLELTNRPTQAVDLGGEWQVDFVASEFPTFLRERREPDAQDRIRSRDFRRRFPGSELDFIAHDFHVLRADKIRIEQGRDSLGIDYEPGVYRDVSWGERERGVWMVRAGWDGTDLVIVSRSEDMKVLERFTLMNPDTLRIRVEIAADGRDHDLERVFDRRR